MDITKVIIQMDPTKKKQAPVFILNGYQLKHSTYLSPIIDYFGINNDEFFLHVVVYCTYILFERF